MNKPIKLYWSSSLKNGRKNVGDWLSPALVEAISGRAVVHASSKTCDLVAIGSILQRVKHHFWNRRIHVWGTGFIASQRPVSPHHYYHAVRGVATASLIKNISIPAMGDPGLLVTRLLPNYESVPKRYRIGVIAHYKDHDNPHINAFIERIPHTTRIDVLAEPADFLQNVAQCEFILSSSLHGLIVADAFGIPNAWIELSQLVRGNQFKFHDYYSVFNITPQPAQLDLLQSQDIDKLTADYARPGLTQVQDNLLASFPSFLLTRFL
jgi:pyruvyltransferase